MWWHGRSRSRDWLPKKPDNPTSQKNRIWHRLRPRDSRGGLVSRFVSYTDPADSLNERPRHGRARVINLHIYTLIDMYTYTYIYANKYTYRCLLIYMYVYIYIHICSRVESQKPGLSSQTAHRAYRKIRMWWPPGRAGLICIYTHIYTYIDTYIYVYICIYIYIHIYI